MDPRFFHSIWFFAVGQVHDSCCLPLGMTRMRLISSLAAPLGLRLRVYLRPVWYLKVVSKSSWGHEWSCARVHWIGVPRRSTRSCLAWASLVREMTMASTGFSDRLMPQTLRLQGNYVTYIGLQQRSGNNWNINSWGTYNPEQASDARCLSCEAVASPASPLRGPGACLHRRSDPIRSLLQRGDRASSS